MRTPVCAEMGRAWGRASRVADELGPARQSIEAVRGGVQPRDTVPPLQREPDILDVADDAEVIIVGEATERRVAVLFSHREFPGFALVIVFGDRSMSSPIMSQSGSRRIQRLERS
jgi:hypothetical protein